MPFLHLVEKEEEVIIKILPLPIPISLPVPAPVHIGVPAGPPFTPSPYTNYNSLPLLKTFGVGPRMNKRQTEQMRTRRSADADHSIIGGHSEISDSHTHTRHHHSHTSHERPSSKIDD